MTVAPTSIQSPREHHRFRWLLIVVLALGAAAVAVGLLFQFDVFGSSSTSTSTVEGSGVAATQTRHVAPFQRVELAGSNNVVIRVRQKQSVVVRADDNLIARVTTEVQQGTLVVGQTPGSYASKSPMSVEVSVPSLDSLTLSGSGNVVVSDIKAQSLRIMLSGSGNLTGAGSATQLDATVSGSGNILFERLLASDVHAVVSGSGDIFVTATKSLDASVPGSGAILYSGNPANVTKSVTGSGTITAK
jgi:hypothetical protein